MSARRTTVASRLPLALEDRACYPRVLTLSLAFARLLLEQRPLGLLPHEIASHLEVSVRHAHRLLASAELAGWPLEKDAEHRYRLVQGAR